MNELVFLKNNQPMTNSLVIAEGTDNEHRSIIRLVQKHQKRFERWGAVRFMDLKSTNPQGGRPTTVAWLNEPQAAFLVTLLRNNDIVLDFKEKLVAGFYKMREILLNRQNAEWLAVREAAKNGNKRMSAVVHEFLLPTAQAQGYNKPERFLHINYNRAINRAACVNPKSRDEQPLGQLYEIEKMQSMVEVAIKGATARGDHFKQIYRDVDQMLENYSRLSFIPQRFLPN